MLRVSGGIALARTPSMGIADVYTYRVLVGKCQLGLGLGWAHDLFDELQTAA